MNESCTCPLEGTVKINGDAAYDVDQGKGGMSATRLHPRIIQANS
jgi:hypothetical protein